MTQYNFDGHTYEAAEDQERLSNQHERIFRTMLDREWRTYNEIEILTGDPQCSISSSLRNMRKSKFGAHIVERQVRGDRKDGLYEYRLLPNEDLSGVVQAPEYIHSGRWTRVIGDLSIKIYKKKSGKNLTDLEQGIIIQKVKDAILAAEAEIRTRRNTETPSIEYEVWDDVHYWNT